MKRAILKAYVRFGNPAELEMDVAPVEFRRGLTSIYEPSIRDTITERESGSARDNYRSGSVRLLVQALRGLMSLQYAISTNHHERALSPFSGAG
jgi:hypothetical protein